MGTFWLFVDSICHPNIFKSILCGKPKRACLRFEGALEVIRISVFSFFFDQPTLSVSFFFLTRSDDLEITLASSRRRDTRNEKERVLSDTVQCCREDQSGVIRSKRSGSTLPCLSHFLVQSAH